MITLGLISQFLPFLGLKLKGLGDDPTETRIIGAVLIVLGGVLLLISRSRGAANVGAFLTKLLLWPVVIGGVLVIVGSVLFLVAIGMGWYSFSNTDSQRVVSSPASAGANAPSPPSNSIPITSPAPDPLSQLPHIPAMIPKKAAASKVSFAKVGPVAAMESLSTGPQLEVRPWSESSGQAAVEGRLSAYGGGHVLIAKPDGQTQTMDFDKLSDVDRSYVTRTMPKGSLPVDTELRGGPGGMPFRFEGQGSPLLGLRWSAGQHGNEQCLEKVEGVYDRTATATAGENLVVAREGYAVGAINIDAARYVHAVQIVFMRVGDDGRLDPSESYTGDWLGPYRNKPAVRLGGTGAIVVGVYGRRTDVVDAVGLIVRGR